MTRKGTVLPSSARLQRWYPPVPSRTILSRTELPAVLFFLWGIKRKQDSTARPFPDLRRCRAASLGRAIVSSCFLNSGRGLAFIPFFCFLHYLPDQFFRAQTTRNRLEARLFAGERYDQRHPGNLGPHQHLFNPGHTFLVCREFPAVPCPLKKLRQLESPRIRPVFELDHFLFDNPA